MAVQEHIFPDSVPKNGDEFESSAAHNLQHIPWYNANHLQIY